MAPTLTPTLARCMKAARALGYRHPQFFILNDRMRYAEDTTIGTMAVDRHGKIFVNPAFVATLTIDELSGCLAHEMLHPTLRHFERARTLGIIDQIGKVAPGREQDARVWNVAGDWCINHSLRADKIPLPKGALFPDPKYLATNGPLQSEAIYHWIKSQQKAGEEPSGMGDPGEGEKSPGAGCGTRPSPQDAQGQGQGQAQGQGEQDQGGLKPGETWGSVAAQARAFAQLAGSGSQAFARLLEPYEPTIDWTRVIRRGFNLGSVRPGNVFSTYSRIARRPPNGDVLRPGWYGGVPSIAFVVDVSSSMAREWVGQIVSEILSCMKTFGTRVYLVTHTDQVCWAGWIQDGDRQGVIDACGHQGGTDPRSAYLKIAEEGTRFEVLAHLTDCEFPCEWPENPARKLVVGAFGSGATEPYTTIPDGAEVIPCHMPG